jgi:hypothetical protein
MLLLKKFHIRSVRYPLTLVSFESDRVRVQPTKKFIRQVLPLNPCIERLKSIGI